MSKIICDVCGVSYPETAEQCPVCGSARPADAQVIPGEDRGNEDGNAYHYVKGGRFSKSNVRKYNSGSAKRRTEDMPADMQPEEREKNNKGLIITAVTLLLAIIAVVAYIVLRIVLPGASGTPIATVPSGTTAPTASALVHCSQIKLADTAIELKTLGAAWLLEAKPTPADTTDTVSYISSDPKIASVTAAGKVQAVGGGKATITVICGNAKATCEVTCSFAGTDETTAPTTEPTTAPSTEALKLNRNDITFQKKGDSWMLYSGSIAKTEITWKSDNEAVATISDGKVVAVGNGLTNVHASYGESTVSCIIRCKFTEAGTSAGTGTVTEDGSQELKLNRADFTLSGRGSSWDVYSGSIARNKITWKSANTAVATVSAGKVVAVGAGTTTISATYNGKTVTCIVRVTLK